MCEIKVSVIIPVYNSQKHLRQCLDSIVNQTLKDIEIICVDDGSVDESLTILKEFQSKDNRIQIVTQKNAGAGSARNHGLVLAKGEYLSFLDSDDFFENDMLEKAYNKAIEGDADVVVFKSDQYLEDADKFQQVSWVLRDKELPPYRPMYHRTFTDNVFKVFVGWAWDKLFKTDFVRKYDLHFQEIRTSNDLLFVFTAIVLAKKIEIIDTVLAHQRRNQKESLSNTREKSWDCFYMALNALKDNLIKYGLYQELEQDYINYALHFSLWHLNTITGEKKNVLYNKLKTNWFNEFGITNRSRSYFYNAYEYKQYLDIMNNEFERWLKIASK